MCLRKRICWEMIGIKMKEAEYKMLREEILLNLKQVSLCSKILYTSVCGILVFSYNKDFLLTLVSYIIILSIQYESSSILKGMIRTSMYLYVFIEDGDKEFSWETSLLSGDKKYGRNYASAISMYIFFSILTFIFSIIAMVNCDDNSCITIFFNMIFGDVYMRDSKIFNSIFLIIVFIVSIYFINKNKVSYLIEKEKQIELWSCIKYEINK